MSTRAQILAEIAAQFPDNTSGLITPAILRTELGTMVDYSDTTAAAAVAGHNADPVAHGAQIAAAVAGLKLPVPILTSVRGRSLSMVCIGDSLCSGNTYTPDVDPNATGWGTQLAWRSQGVLWLRHNAGKPSDLTASMLARFADEVAPYSPDIVVIMGGTNDAACAVATESIVTNIAELCRRARTINAIPVVLALTPRTGALNATIKAVNTRLLAVCSALGVLFVDTHTPMCNPDGTANEALFSDGCHFVEAGAIVVAETAKLGVGWYDAGSRLAAATALDPDNKVGNSFFAGAVSGSPGTEPTDWWVSGAGMTNTFRTDAAGNVWWKLVAGAEDCYAGCTLPLLTGGTRAVFGARLNDIESLANGDIMVNLQSHAYGTYSSAKVFNGIVREIDGLVHLESAIPAGNDASTFLVKAASGKTIEFTTPFVRVAP